MGKFLKIVGIVIVAWIVLGLVWSLIAFTFKAIFWIALIAGGIYAVTAIANKAKHNQVGRR